MPPLKSPFYLGETFLTLKNKPVIVNFFAYKNNYACLIYAKNYKCCALSN